ncbi:MAG: phosphatase PAP2 family protein [Propionibacteriaceae bacterium]|jgi:membrane-associated phospholipid phosphatase|nr:phosphatase PAP2 family protein [Propionibacteriaceae bacterium]
MPPSPNRPVSPVWPLLAGGLFLVLTTLVATGATAGFDRALEAPSLDPVGQLAQILLVIAVVTHPFVLIAVGLALAIWLARRRRRLAWVVAAGMTLGPLVQLGLKAVFQRARPESTLAWAIGQGGYAYPSGHATAIAIMTLLVVRVVGDLQVRRIWRQVGAALAILVVTLDRWAMSAHWVTDLVGGVLWGTTVATTGLVILDRTPGGRRELEVADSAMDPWEPPA